jgi:hypothetical protein
VQNSLDFIASLMERVRKWVMLGSGHGPSIIYLSVGRLFSHNPIFPFRFATRTLTARSILPSRSYPGWPYSCCPWQRSFFISYHYAGWLWSGVGGNILFVF